MERQLANLLFCAYMLCIFLEYLLVIYLRYFYKRELWAAMMQLVFIWLLR